MRRWLLWLTLPCLLSCGTPPPSPTTSGETATTSEASMPEIDLDQPRLVVLGTVQDGGLPHAGCSCVRCEAAHEDPSKRRLVASLGLLIPGEGDERTQVHLVDASPDVPAQLRLLRPYRDWDAGRVDRTPVDGVLLTHAHVGHYLGLAHFGFEVMHAREVTAHCSQKMAAFLQGHGPWSQLVRKNEITISAFEPGDTVSLGGGVEFQAVQVPHRDELSDTMGFLLRGPRATVFYVPDTDSWDAWTTRSITEFLTQEKVDVAIVDGTFYSLEELPGRKVTSIGHPLIEQSLDLFGDAVQAGELEVWFTHLNHSNPALEDDSTARRELERRGFGVLAEGQVFEL
ncbi:MAG: MBL fold metallo-hydrolase [Acidobacteriota bacterium]